MSSQQEKRITRRNHQTTYITPIQPNDSVNLIVSNQSHPNMPPENNELTLDSIRNSLSELLDEKLQVQRALIIEQFSKLPKTEDFDVLNVEINNLKTEGNLLKNEIKVLRHKNIELESKFNYMEKQMKGNNLLFRGFDFELTNRDATVNGVQQFCTKTSMTEKTPVVLSCNPIGKPNEAKKNKVCLLNFKVKMMSMI